MTVNEYIAGLSAALAGFDKEEAESAVGYYTELLEDAEAPEELMSSFGTPEQLAARIIQESGHGGYYAPPPIPTDTDSGGKRMSAGRIAALVFTFPLWLTVYILIASLVIMVVSVMITIPVTAAACLVSAVKVLFIYPPYALLLFSEFLLGSGILVLLSVPMLMAIKGSVGLFGKFSGFLFGIQRKLSEKKEKKPFTKRRVIAGASIFAVGLVMIGIVAVIKPNQEDFADSLGLESVTKKYDTDISAIDLDSSVAEIRVLPSADDIFRLECKNVEADALSADQRSDGRKGTLSVKYNGKDKWLYNFNLNVFDVRFPSIPRPEITLYIPSGEYQKIRINSAVGDIRYENIKAESLELHTNVGAVNIDSCVFGALDADIDLGDIDIKNTNISETCFIDASCGEVSLSSVNAVSFEIENDMGDTKITRSGFENIKLTNACGSVEINDVQVNGSISGQLDMGDAKLIAVTAGSIDIKMNCGNFDFDGELTGESGESTVNVDLGEVDMSLAGSDYTVKADTDLGTARINGEAPSLSDLSGRVVVRIHNSCGDIDVESGR